ncbi:MAG: hypothetical protein AABX48_03710 [Nanoarchaeota archaeon]
MLRKAGTKVCANPSIEYILAFTEYKILGLYEKGFVYVSKPRILEALGRLKNEGSRIFEGYKPGEEELAYKSQIVKIRENTAQTPKEGWAVCFFTTSVKVLEELVKGLSLPFSKGKIYRSNSREEKENFIFEENVSWE